MKNTRSVVQGLMLCVCLVASFAAVAEEQSIVVDSNGDYVFTYEGYRGWQKVKWVPATKINPAVKGIIRPVTGKSDNLSYNYTVRNGKDSRQFLVGMRLSASNVLSADPRKPEGWVGHATLDRAAGSGFIVGWFFRRSGGPWEAGLKPGAAVSGIGLDSKDLPGVDKVALWGASPSGQSFPDEGPNEGPFRDELLRILDNDFVTRLAAVPRIAVPSPFDAAVVLTGLQKHIKTDMTSLQLIDPTLLSLIDRGLSQAIAAVQGGNTPSLLHEIKNLRQLLKQEHAEVDKDDEGDRNDDDKEKQTKPRIDKLAARVLNFDLKYVEKRVKGDKD